MYYCASRLSSEKSNKFNLELQQHLYLNITCCKQKNNPDPNILANCITNGYLLPIEKYMPIQSLSHKQRGFFNKPWIRKCLKICIKTKKKMFKLAKKVMKLELLKNIFLIQIIGKLTVLHIFQFMRLIK